MDDLQNNLANYTTQLQQVESALTSTPENEDLLKLKQDLTEVLDLTKYLIANQLANEGNISESNVSASTSATEQILEANSTVKPQSKKTKWRIGQRCLALYDDQRYYPANIEEIHDDGNCTVTYSKYNQSKVTKINLLRPIDASTGMLDDKKKNMSKKDLWTAQREYKKKKAEKKRSRMKEIEEEREKEKNKWQSFNAKAFNKTTKGKVKKSIFASPDNGRIGVGTCGMAGQPMTEFRHRKKWNKS